MAIYYFRVKCGTKAVSHLLYINREDKYQYKPDLIINETKNLPKDFKNINDFWESAVLYERKNANIYREFEISLVKEFDDKKNKEILDSFLEKTFKKDYVYNYAFHNPSGKQPHAHIMFCDRKLDGIERDKEKFFKRYNPKDPELGGAKKDENIKKKDKILEFRNNWEEHLNLYLLAAGLEKVSSKTLKQQRDEALKNGDIDKANMLDRNPIDIRKKFKYVNSEDHKISIEELNDKIRKDQYLKEKNLRDEINRLKFENQFRNKYENKDKEFKYKSFEEVLKEKEKVEIEIFKLTKRMDDKTLEFIVADKMCNGKINKLKNENRSLFKKMKNSKKEEKSELKNKINKNNEYINKFMNDNKEKIKEEALKQKGKYMSVLKYKIQDKEIIDKIFEKKLIKADKTNPKILNLYKAYIERKDMREEKLKEEKNINNNKDKIVKFLKEKNYSGIKNLKEKNSFSRSSINYINSAKRNFDRSNKVKKEILKHGEFLLDEYEHILWDEEYELGQFEK